MNDMQDASDLEAALIENAKAHKHPLNASFELSPLCNLDCRMCFVRLSRSEMEKRGRLLSLDEWYEIARKLKEAGTLFLLLTGGEPLLYPDFTKLYLSLKKLGFILTINTNGTLIDDEFATMLSQNKPRRVNVTLYGSRADDYDKLCGNHKGFDAAVNGIRLLHDNGIDLKVNYSATKDNADRIDDVIKLCDSLGVPINIDSYMYPVTRERDRAYDHTSRLSPQEAAKVWIKNLRHTLAKDAVLAYAKNMIAIIEKAKGSGEENPIEGTVCLAGNCSFSVNWQGMIRPCVMLSKPEISALDTDFGPAWERLTSGASKLSIPKRCASCHLRSLCRVCPANADLETDAFGEAPEYLCRLAECMCRELLDIADEK